MPIFDTHAHYTASAFHDDRDALLAGLPARGVALVLDCGTDLDSSLASLALAEQYSFLYTAAGIHPESLIEEDASTQTRFQGDWRRTGRAAESQSAGGHSGKITGRKGRGVRPLGEGI